MWASGLSVGPADADGRTDDASCGRPTDRDVRTRTTPSGRTIEYVRTGRSRFVDGRLKRACLAEAREKSEGRLAGWLASPLSPTAGQIDKETDLERASHSLFSSRWFGSPGRRANQSGFSSDECRIWGAHVRLGSPPSLAYV